MLAIILLFIESFLLVLSLDNIPRSLHKRSRNEPIIIVLKSINLLFFAVYQSFLTLCFFRHDKVLFALLMNQR